MNRHVLRVVLAGLLLAILVAGCTNAYYRKSADQDTYGIIKSKTPLVPDMDGRFTIKESNAGLPEGLPLATNVPAFLGPDGQREHGARILTLEQALAVGVHCSRAYQSRKEQLYLAGLSLTRTRHDFAPLFSAPAGASYLSDNLVDEQVVQANGSLQASWLIRDVGKLTTALTVDVLRFVGGDGRAISSSRLAATFTRPLWRNATYKAEVEVLTQAERQLLYDLRDFTRYRKDFSVQVAAAYYNVLGLRDTVRNSFSNLQSSRDNADRGRALAEEGRMTQSDLGRLEQQVLSAESTWNNALRNYQQALDNFKFQLGLSVETKLSLADRELAALRIRDPKLDVANSIRIALAARLDYLTAKDELDDAVRKVNVAASLLRPKVDLEGSVNFVSDDSRNTGIQWPEFSRYTWEAGLAVDPGLERVSERNAYRAAIIARSRSARAIVEQEDQIQLQVRDSWRTLDQAKRNYEINELGVKLAERRVEEQNLLAELGRAKAQDQVDAQNDLISSKNQLTQALVTHTIARLQFWNNLGILYIKDNGQWQEIEDAKTQ